MDKHKSAIAEYERCRQAVRDASKRRCDLIIKCEKLDEYGIGINCLTACYETRNKWIEENGELYAFDEVLGEEGCQYCYQSHVIKTGDLAKAKRLFGIAKRRISQLGKSLILESGDANNHN